MCAILQRLLLCLAAALSGLALNEAVVGLKLGLERNCPRVKARHDDGTKTPQLGEETHKSGNDYNGCSKLTAMAGSAAPAVFGGQDKYDVMDNMQEFLQGYFKNWSKEGWQRCVPRLSANEAVLEELNSVLADQAKTRQAKPGLILAGLQKTFAVTLIRKYPATSGAAASTLVDGAKADGKGNGRRSKSEPPRGQGQGQGQGKGKGKKKSGISTSRATAVDDGGKGDAHFS